MIQQLNSIAIGSKLLSWTTITTIVAAIVAVLPKNCDAQKGDTIIDLLGNNLDLSVMYNAIQTNNISDALVGNGGPVTLFAPINIAFSPDNLNETILARLLYPSYKFHLDNVLLYHGMDGVQVLSSDLPDGVAGNATMANGDLLFITRKGSNITLGYEGSNKELVNVSVVTPDNVASDGVIHTIDGILLPKFVFTPLVQLLKSDHDFAIFSELYTIAFQDRLPTVTTNVSDDGAYTFFVPVNDAFLKLGNATLDTIKADKKTLKSLVEKHIYYGMVTLDNFTDGTEVTTLGASVVQLGVTGGDYVVNYDSKLVSGNRLAIDGIVHAIDRVLFTDGIPITTTAPAKAPVATPTTTTKPVSVPTTPTASGTSDSSPIVGMSSIIITIIILDVAKLFLQFI